MALSTHRNRFAHTMPRVTMTLTVPEDACGQRLDQAMARLCPEHSRARLQSWIRRGQVTVDGRQLPQKHSLSGGETIYIDAEYEGGDPSWSRDDIPLDIIHVDADLLIINKPPGLVVHPGAGNRDRTLLNALLFHYPELEQVPRAGIVHRLDKATSGLMVIARTPVAHTNLVEQLQQRRVRREYQAVVSGALTGGGKVEAPIGRHPSQRTRMAVVASGKPALTHYRLLRRYAAHSHILCRLESGRTHQIRVHMAHLRHPLVGDPVYGGRPVFPKQATAELRRLLESFPRQALHASRLQLTHPGSGEVWGWESPLPADLQELLDALDRDALRA